MSRVLPTSSEVLREGLVLIGGAIVAALILSQLPQLRAWIAANTRGTTSAAGGCDCNH